MLDLIHTREPPSLRHKLRSMCEKYIYIFSTAFQAESTDQPQMTIEVDKTKGSLTNTDYPRTHSVENNLRLENSVPSCKAWGVIRHSMASEWNQVHIVPKPIPEKGDPPLTLCC